VNKSRTLFLLLLVALISAGVYLNLPSKAYMHRGKTIPEWVAQLEASDQAPRTQAGAAFREMGARAVPELETLLTTPESPGRDGMVAIARLLPPRDRVALLQKMGRMERSSWRSGSAKALGFIGPEAKNAIPKLEEAMQDPHPQVRLEAALALGKIGRASVPALLRGLEKTNSAVRLLAARILGELEPEAPPVSDGLRKVLKDPDPAVRGMAAWALSQTNQGTPR
jgi:HEAT repeat protein